MGYNTRFEGDIAISPPASALTLILVNTFCDDQDKIRGKEIDNRPSDGWCDWRVAKDGASIGHSGMEKSRCMEAWLEYLIRKFFIPGGYHLEGEIRCQGEDFADRYLIKVVDNRVTKEVLK